MTAAHHLIQRKAASKRTPLLDDQAAHMAQLIEHLAKSACDHFGVRDVSELRDDQHQAFCALPAYDMFIVGAYACGFVMRDGLPKNPLETIDRRPNEAIEVVDLPTLRQVVHYLIRSERWSLPYASDILNALINGLLPAIAERLRRDDSLYAPC